MWAECQPPPCGLSARPLHVGSVCGLQSGAFHCCIQMFPLSNTVREKFPNTMVSEIRALLRRKCNNEGYTKVAPQ
ncbi:unnamed protein product [Gadus morhua 'NCC']